MGDRSIGRGTVLAGRFRLEDLVQDTDGAKFWRAVDQILARSVAVNVVDADDPRSEALLSAARTSATITEGHFLRVLDAAREDGVAYVVHEWGTGISLDRMLTDGPLSPRRAAWLVKEVAEAISYAHAHGIAHGRLVPENVMVTEAGSVKLIGFVVDAVLHGPRQPAMPDGRALSDHESDIHNLAALLYSTLVAKWPGSLDSKVPSAPRDHERVLRPRQVRAGVPRPLDAICDQVLNPDDQNGSLETAHEIRAALSDFIGETVAPPAPEETTVLSLQEREQEALRREQAGRRRSATGGTAGAGAAGAGSAAPPAAGQAEDPEATRAVAFGADPEATQATAFGYDPEATQASPGPLPTEDPDATQASPPWFGGDQRRTPPPPPPFTEPEPRPLFAPEPRRSPTRATSDGAGAPTGAMGASGRGAVAGSADDTGDPVHGLHATHGTGSLPPRWGPDEPAEPDPGWSRRDSSRDWLKLAGAVGVIALLVLAIVFAFNLGRGAGSDPTAQESPTSTPSSAPPQPIQVASVSDLDPPPDGNGEENPELTGLAVDGDPATAWETLEYYNNPQFGLLKDGVGLVVDLGSAQEVSRVEVTVQGSPTSFEVYAAPDATSAPTSVEGLRRVASVTGAGGHEVVRLREPVTTRFLVVWLTSLPPSDGAFRGRVAEIVVKG